MGLPLYNVNQILHKDRCLFKDKELVLPHFKKDHLIGAWVNSNLELFEPSACFYFEGL